MKLKYTLLVPLMLFFITSFGQNVKKKTELKPVPVESINSPRFTTYQRPMTVEEKKTSNHKVNVKEERVVKNEVIRGEGKYLTFTKDIMKASVTGGIPIGFPKHVKGQSKEAYVEIMKKWARENPDKIKPEYRQN